MADSHFAAGFLGKEIGGHPYILLQGYSWKGQYQLKAPGGDMQDGEKPIETVIRELQRETHLLVSKKNLTLVHKEERPSDDGDGIHTKYFYASHEFSGRPRSEEIGDIGGETLHIPKWYYVDKELLDRIFRTHQEAAREAVRFFGGHLEYFDLVRYQWGLDPKE